MTVQRIGTYGALFSFPDESSGLSSSMALPEGGRLVVDLLRPDRMSRLELTPAALTSALGSRLKAMHDNGERIDPDKIGLPASYVRRAVVDGVVRWSDLPLDEGLLLADRALAAAEAGDKAGSVALYERARPALSSLGERLTEAQVVEVSRVLAAAPAGYGVPPPSIELPRTSGILADSLRPLDEESMPKVRAKELRFRSRRWSGRGTNGLPVLIDPLAVPARVVAEGATAELGDYARIAVVVPAAPGITANRPVAQRLLVRLVDLEVEGPAGTEGIVGLAPLELADGQFRADLRVPVSASERLLVEVRDASVRSASRSSDRGRAEVAALRSLCEAWMWERRAAARQVSGDAEGATLDLVDRTSAMRAAMEPLRLLDRELPHWLDLVAPSPVRAEYVDSTRPLLAELSERD